MEYSVSTVLCAGNSVGRDAARLTLIVAVRFPTLNNCYFTFISYAYRPTLPSPKLWVLLETAVNVKHVSKFYRGLYKQKQFNGTR